MYGCWYVLYFLLLTCVIGVISKKTYKDGDVKLVGGKKRHMGTVLVRHNNRWGAICDGAWDKKDAHTVCNQLGYYAAASAPRGSKFGIGRKRMFLFSLGCSGKESSIKECPYAAFSRFWRRRCPGDRRTAGVVCYPARRKKQSRNRKSRRTTKRQTTAAPTSTTTSANVSIERRRSLLASASTSSIKSTSIPTSKFTSKMLSKSTSTLASPTATTPASSVSTHTSMLTSKSTSTSVTTPASIPDTTSTSTPVTASSSTPVATSSSTPVTTSSSTPVTASSSTPVTASSSTQVTTSSSTPVTASSSTQVTTPTSIPLTTSTSTPVTTSSSTPVTTSSSTPVMTSSTTPVTTPSSTPVTTSSSTPDMTPSSTPVITPPSTLASKSTSTLATTIISTLSSIPSSISTSKLKSASTTKSSAASILISTSTTSTPNVTVSSTQTGAQTTSSTNHNHIVSTVSFEKSFDTTTGTTYTSEGGETISTSEGIYTEENDILASVGLRSETPVEAMDSEYKRVAEGVKSDSPDASIDFPVPFNMISGDSLEKKNSYKQTDKYANGKSEVLLADAPKEQKVDLELTGGRYDNEGYIRVRVNKGKWTTVCSDHWTIREALVACNQIGNFGQAKQAVTVNFYGGETENRDIYRIKCVGRETNLSKCNLTKADDEHVCSKKRAVAGIVCSKQLPDLVPNLKAIEQTMRLQDQPLYYLRCSMEENCLSNSAYVLRNTSRHWRSQYRRLMRFSTIVRNEGTADFRPVLQRSAWQWHACHMHYHSMEVFAHYDIMDANGNRLAEGSKASFCLEDTACDSGVDPTYNCRGFGEQGLSVNCSDNYMYNIDCQWIDVTDIKPGHYTFLMEINPDMLVPESSFDNNVVSCHLHYSAYNARLRDCHFESLLDYRRPQKLPV